MKNARKRERAIRMNRWMLKASRRWLRIALVVVGLYASLPIVAPMLMQIGWTGPANVIYTIYKPMCHQFAFRSIFLYGDQTFYPREIVGTEMASYESYINQIDALPDVTNPTDFSPSLWMPAREFVGNAQMGYKTALCARDVAIYVALFLGGVIFAFVRRWLRPVPMLLYIFLGLGPIGIDGASQLLSYPPFELWPVRETAPFYRVLTGALFGFMTAWLGYPYLELSMQETREQIEAKFRQARLPIP